MYRSYLEHTHQKLLDRMDIKPGETVLDSSAGTGLMAEDLLQKFDIRKIVMNDPADDMLNIARERLKNKTIDIAYTNYFTEHINQLLPETFDHIICLNSFHYYVDQPLALSNFQKLLNPGGTLWLLDWNREGFFTINSKLIDWFSTMNINTRSLTETISLLKTNGFTIVHDENWHYRLWNFFFVKAKVIY